MVQILLITAALACFAAAILHLRWTFADVPTLQRTSLGLLAVGAAALVGSAVAAVMMGSDLTMSARVTLFVAAGGTIVYLGTRLWRDVPISSLVAASLAGVTALAVFLKGFDSHIADPGAGMSTLTAIHVAAVVLGFVAFIPAYVLSVLFVSQEHRIKSKKLGTGKPASLPSLMALERRAWQLLYIGFPLYTVGVAMGLLFQPAGAFATLRPQHILAAISWFVYGVAIYRRWSTGWRGRRAALTLMGAFITTFGAVLMYMMR